MDGFVRMAALAFVMGLLTLLWWAAKQKRVFGSLSLSLRGANSLSKIPGVSTSASNRISVIQRTRLTPTHHLHWISTGEETFLLCTHPGGCSVVTNSPRLPFESKEEDIAHASHRN